MKNHFLLIYLSVFVIIPNTILAQINRAPNFGIASSFVLFTRAGAVSGTGNNMFTGNVGLKNAGEMTGITASNVKGRIYNAVGDVTTKCDNDINAAYTDIMSRPSVDSGHSPTYGSSTAATPDIIYPGVYKRTNTTACNFAGDLIFDAAGDTTALFIIIIPAAVTSSAGFSMHLVNKAAAGNIFFVIQGALSFAVNNTLYGTFLIQVGALDVAGGSTLYGRVVTTTGAITVADLKITLPPGLAVNYWNGYNYGSTEWFSFANWTIDIPSLLSNTVISKNLAANPYYPVIHDSIGQNAVVSNLTIENGALLTILNNPINGNIGKLAVSGAVKGLAGINASAGTLEFDGISSIPQILPANLCVDNNIQNLILSNSVIMNGFQNITGNLSYTGNNRIFTTNDSLVFKSTATGTAQFADITNNGTSSGNTISGKVIIERYISPKRAWRLLSIPIVANSNAPTINAAWQEGTNAASLVQNPVPGYGTHITTGDALYGYDKGINSNPSLKIYDTVLNTFVGLPLNPGTITPITSYPAYFIFIRGDRTTNLQQGIWAAVTNTTLRMQGNIIMGLDTIAVHPKNFTLVSNPYPAAINFATITKNNVANNLYLWNPQLAGVGGYVTISPGTSVNDYITVPNGNNSSQYIQSGDAFFVQALDTTQPASIIIKETDKNSTGSDNVFRPMTTSSSMRVNLSGINATDSSLNLVDGIYTSYADNYTNVVDNKDVKKIYNIGENICLGRDKQLLAIERRQTILSTDTSFIKLYLLKKQKYQFAISAGNMNNYGINAVLKDNYDSAINNRVINLSGAINNINFTVNTDAGSFAIDRFSIVYSIPLIVLPVNFAGIEVSRQQKNILLSWKIANEVNIKEYSIETAASINAFAINATVAAKFNNGSLATYNWLDINASEGMHYYRIKSVDFSGKEMYSSIVKIKVENDQTTSAVNAYPNLISDNKITYKLNNIKAGIYNVSLLNVEGRLIKTLVLQHDGTSNTVHYIYLNSNVASGKYILQLTGNSTKYSTSIIKE